VRIVHEAFGAPLSSLIFLYIESLLKVVGRRMPGFIGFAEFCKQLDLDQFSDARGFAEIFPAIHSRGPELFTVRQTVDQSRIVGAKAFLESAPRVPLAISTKFSTG
jgi:hypothetical protein